MTAGFSVIIPTFRGLSRLRENFPAVHEAARRADPACDFVVVDDAGRDGSVEWLASAYPDVVTMENPRNLGFIGAANRGVLAARRGIVVLLNDDVRPSGDPFTPALRHFDDPLLFGVTFRALFPGSMTFREGAKAARWRAGTFSVLHAERDFPAPLPDGRVPSLYPVGGHCAIRKAMFTELVGFDPLFAPFYWEDADLGWRAWKRGWKTIYEPASEVIHDEKGTIRSLNRDRDILTVRYRNRWLFIWKNLRKPSHRMAHVLFVALRFFTSWATGDILFYRSLLKAWPMRHIVRPEKQGGPSDDSLIRLLRSGRT